MVFKKIDPPNDNIRKISNFENDIFLGISFLLKEVRFLFWKKATPPNIIPKTIKSTEIEVLYKRENNPKNNIKREIQ